MENQQSPETVSQPPGVSGHGPVVVHFPPAQPKQPELRPQIQGDTPDEDVGKTHEVDRPPATLPYADVARRAIAEPSPLVIVKRSAPKATGQFEDPIAFPTLNESRMRAASEPKRASRRCRSRHLQLSPPSSKESEGGEGSSRDMESPRREIETVVNSPKVPDSPAQNQVKSPEYNKPMSALQNPAEPEELTKDKLEDQSFNKGSEASQPSTELSSEDPVVENNEQSFIAQLKATFNIVEKSQPGPIDVVKSTQLGGENKQSHTNNPSPSAESARQLNCEAKVFFPKPKASAGPNCLSLPAINPFQEGSRSSPSSPFHPRTIYKGSSVPPTPLQEVTFDAAENPPSPPEPSHTRRSSSETVIAVPDGTPQNAIQGIIMGGPALSPTRQGTYATERNPEIVEHRSVPSMHGVVDVAVPENMPLTVGWDQGHMHGNWHRLSAPYSPSIYDTASTLLRPEFGSIYPPPEAAASRMAHVAIPCENLDRLFCQIQGLSSELGLVRAEVQAQTFQLQQLTAHVNVLRSQNGFMENQFSVPTPTAAFRTPPYTGTNEFQNRNGSTGSPIGRSAYHQPQVSNATVHENGDCASMPVGRLPEGSVSGNHGIHIPAPIAKDSVDGTVDNTVNQSATYAGRRNPNRPITIGEKQKDPANKPRRGPAAGFGKTKHNRPTKQSPDPQAKPMIVNSPVKHRRTVSNRSQQTSQFNPFVPPFNPGEGQEHTTHNDTTHRRGRFGSDSAQSHFAGTWGGTRNWYHHAYGNENAQN
ncbi:hypothetical protein DIZ76_016761 [Coccidioides immitis]|nr:hypothetical protein DIZ76_016761 [Coccidioides immitis]